MSFPLSNDRQFRFVSGIFGVVTLSIVFAVSSKGTAATKVEKQREADQLIREALNREIYGMHGQRQQLLARALELVPNHAAPLWHTGHVRVGNQWFKVDEFRETQGQKRRRELYERQRAKTPETADGQLTLANWCADHKMRPQEVAHLYRVIQIAPNHPGARTRLGFQRVGARWVKRQDIWQGARDAKSVAQAVKKWQPTFEKICKGLRQDNPRQRAAAEERLLSVLTDDAIPALEAILATRSEPCAMVAVKAMGTMTGHEAAGALVRQAVFSFWSSVRGEAARQLSLRPRDHYVPVLLDELSTPVESRIQTALVDGRILYRHAFVRETQERKQVNVLDTAFERRPSLALTDNPGGFVGAGAAQQAISTAGADTTARAVADLQEMASTREWTRLRQNALIHQMNERLCHVLSVATGEDLPPSPEVWWEWWNEVNEITFPDEKPSDTQYNREVLVYEDITPVIAGPETSGEGSGGSRAPCECFVAGTPVWTIDGLVDIDKIQVGDLVLSQHPDTGELAYKPVLRTTVRPAEPLVKIRLCTPDGKTLEGSGGHPLWVSGEGWVLLRKLQSGTVLHGVGGPVVISEVEEGSVQETFNLIVDGFHTYVVGGQKILCHDNTPRRPTNAVVPGLLER